ncbi:MAG: cell envelope integrity protein TolA [Gammaproteobacteria bacterium]|nr:cell envelope integrity protein TolA [Gammaproteobacteria bacterium]
MNRRRSSGLASSIGLSLILHLALFALLFVGFDFQRRTPRAPTNPGPVVKASVVDAQSLQQEIDRLEQAEAARQQRLIDEKRRLAEAEKARKQAEARKQQAVEATRKAAQQKQQAEVEARAAADQKRQAEAQAKLARERQQKIEAEAARKAAQAKAREEAAKKAAAEQARKEADRKAREAAAKALQDAIAAEESSAQRQRDLTLVEQYTAAIRQQVEGAWLRPDGWPAGMSCTVAVRLMPGGEVLEVKRVEHCGGDRFARSAETAVFRASPLQVPEDSRLFHDNFRSFNFKFNPTEDTGR